MKTEIFHGNFLPKDFQLQNTFKDNDEQITDSTILLVFQQIKGLMIEEKTFQHEI